MMSCSYVHPTVCALICYQHFEHDNLKMSELALHNRELHARNDDELILREISTSGPRGKGIKRLTLGLGRLTLKVT